MTEVIALEYAVLQNQKYEAHNIPDHAGVFGRYFTGIRAVTLYQTEINFILKKMLTCNAIQVDEPLCRDCGPLQCM